MFTKHKVCIVPPKMPVVVDDVLVVVADGVDLEEDEEEYRLDVCSFAVKFLVVEFLCNPLAFSIIAGSSKKPSSG